MTRHSSFIIVFAIYTLTVKNDLQNVYKSSCTTLWVLEKKEDLFEYKLNVV